jgi:hypothetical protein
MQENATLKALNVELDRKIKDYEGRTTATTTTTAVTVPSTTPRGSVHPFLLFLSFFLFFFLRGYFNCKILQEGF